MIVRTSLVLVISLMLSISGITGQVLAGYVFAEEQDGTEVPLAGATIFYADTDTGTLSLSDGSFSIEFKNYPALVAQYLGYHPDTVRINDTKTDIRFLLRPNVESAETIYVEGFRKGTVLSSLATQKVETITGAGLLKMACCNLSESFENSATVTVGFSDAVSGAKQVQLLGLSGIYSQMMSENIPVMRGLASTYGWSHTPGPWLESIQISKGASSVVNGYESVTGQMNLEFKKPNDTEDLYINLFADDALRLEANITTAVKVSDKLWAGLLVHGSVENKEHDRDGDGFMDLPRTKFVNLYNRWFWLDPGKGIESRTGLKFLYEDRKGGQLKEYGSDRYMTNILNRSFAIENKTGFTLGEKEGQSLGIISSFTHYKQNSGFGRKSYEGSQNSFYLNTLFSSYIGSPSHRYTAGASFTYDNYLTAYSDELEFNLTPETEINRTEAVPGAYIQYTFEHGENLTFLTGLRADHNSHYGWLLTPRANIRYAASEYVTLRASAGLGYRSPNVIAENIGLMASSRRFDVSSIHGLEIEKAWNYGGNIAFTIPAGSAGSAILSLDYFHTNFRDRAVVDVDRNRHEVYFYNLRGRSFADVWQADFSVTPLRGFDIFAAFRYNNTKLTLSDGQSEHLKEQPLTNRYRGLINLSYATNFKKWVFDITGQVNGPARIPGHEGYESQKENSPVYQVWFAQVTKNTKRFDIYVGIENIFDYRQKDPIIEPENPFGRNFDSSMVWGPLMGRKIYAGIRLRIGKF